jgi:hypothetical protein
MPYYTDRKKPLKPNGTKSINLLFIHIPKTGGSIIEYKIIRQYKQSVFSGATNAAIPPYNGISLQHQFYSTLYKYRDELEINFENIKIFCVVRNPYDRIISDLLWRKSIKTDFTAEQVYDVIKNNYLYKKNLDNHNMPQYKFVIDENLKVNPDIKIFKCEELNEINDELNKFLEFNINIKQKNVNKDYSMYLNKNSISLINEFYEKDFELFNYDLK